MLVAHGRNTPVACGGGLATPDLSEVAVIDAAAIARRTGADAGVDALAARLVRSADALLAAFSSELDIGAIAAGNGSERLTIGADNGANALPRGTDLTRPANVVDAIGRGRASLFGAA